MYKKVIMFGVIAIAVAVFAETPTVTDVVAKQRFPWNGKVDITYTLTGDMTAGLPDSSIVLLSVTASNRVDGATYAAAASALSGDTGTAEGAHHVVWDLNAQGIEFVSDDVVFTVGYVPIMRYCIIDLSAGADASSYPVTYLADVPSGGFNTDEYKTTKLVLRLVEPGTFMMGGTYQVTLTKPFYCGVFEVTQRQWELVTGSNPCSSTSCGKGDSYPVHYVSYKMIRGSSAGAGWPGSTAVDGSSFLGKLQARTGINFDLPTEAQWEYACRAGTTTTYSYGNSVDGNYMWYSSNSSSKSHVVGTRQPNAWGLYDMHGNVQEWCLDWSGSLSSGVTDPVGSSSGSYRVQRGGCWNSSAGGCTSSYRDDYSPSSGYSVIYGFRLVRTLSNTEGERSPAAVAGAERADALCAAEAAPVAIDSRVGVAPVLDSVVLSYDAAWIGGDTNATVVIADNGTEVRRTTGAGAFTHTLLGGGRHELTYITYIDGVAQDEVYAITVYAPYGVVFFDANGGNVDESSRDVASGCAIGELPVPICAGSTFAGWWTSANGGTRISASTTVKDNVTYYAHWTINSYTLTFDANGGTGGTSTRQNYGTAIIAPTVARTGYTFTGWSPTVADTVPDNDVTYTAQWQVNQYMVTFDANGGVGGTSVTQDYGTAVTVPDVQRENYMFVGWSPAFQGTMLAKDTTYVAQWLCEWRCVTNADDTLTITGVNFTPMGVVVIPSEIDGYPVTGIGAGVFDRCNGLTSVTIPEGVVSLGDGCFNGCNLLTNLTFMSEGTSLGNNDLRNVGRLFELQPDGYWVVQGALVGFKGECPATIPDADTLVRVMPGALEGCTALTGLKFSAASMLTNIGTTAFKGCTELQSLVLPPSLEEIGDEAFMGCSYLENMIVPGSVKRVGTRAFKNCTGFTAAQIEHGVESIGNEAFYGDWQIAEVDIPSTVTNIGVNAFGGDSSIIRVGLRGDVRSVSEIFSNYQYIREATVKAGTGPIKANLFNGCSQLDDVHFFGNSPSLGGVNIYMNTPSTLTTYVARDSTGWDGTPGSHALPQAWPLSGSYRRSIAWWDEPTYLVRFDSNGGTLGVQDTYQRSERPFVLPPEPVLTGYTFAGWWTKPSGGLRVTADTVFIEGVYTYLYAHWMKPYRVFLDPDGGTVTNDYVIYLDQTVYGVLPAAVRTGYAFGGWRYNGRNVLPDTHITTSAEHTLTAQWEAYQYSIQFDSNGGAGLMSAQPMVYDEEAPLASNQFTKTGSLFRGWATASDGAVAYREQASVMNLTAVADDVVTLYAVWQEKPASVLACEDAFGGAGTVTLDEDDNIVVTLTNDVSGTVEIPDNVGNVAIDLDGHSITGTDGGAAILVVAGDGDGDTTRLTIGDTCDGEKGQIAGDGESAGIEFSDDAKPGVRLDVEDEVSVLNGDGSEQPWWELSPVEHTLKAGEYFKMTLAELGYEVPTNGTAYSVTAYGLPAGLQLKYNAAVKDKKGKVIKKAKCEWWIEGVPTAALDFFTNPPYLVIAAGTAAPHAEPLPIEVLAQEVTPLDDLELGQSINTNGWLAGVGAGWTVSGLPTGLKYATKKVTKKSGKKTVTVAEAYSVYGKTTKAGLYTITAKKPAVAGRPPYQTMKYRVLVRPKEVDTAVFGEGLTNIVTMAYVPVGWDLTEGGSGRLGEAALPDGGRGATALPAVSNVAKVSGLPGGVTFAAADTYAYTNAKKKTGKYLKQAGQTIVGTPTKPGTYVVTFTKNVKSGKKTVAKTAQMLWVVEPNDAKVELGFNDKGGVIESGVVGLNYDGTLLAFSATSNATVTASGLPAGMKLVRVEEGGSRPVATGSGTDATERVPPAWWAFTGYTAKAGTYLVTVKATLNGKTVTQRLALEVKGLPTWAKGTYNGCVLGTGNGEWGTGNGEWGTGNGEQGTCETNGLATVTVSAVGKISGKFYEGGTNWTLTAASYTGYDTDASNCTATVTAKYSWKVKSGKKTVTKSVSRTFTLTVAPDEFGGVATLTETGESQSSATEITAWQNLWGSTYKAVGKALFTSKSGKKTLANNTFTIKGSTDVGTEIGLREADTLTLKVTSAGAVTATLSYDTGKTKKDPKTKKTEKVIYNATCQSVVVPQVAADEEPFAGEVPLYFAPSAANGFSGFAGWVAVP